ncbi:hypothetical protein N4G70_35850 [Streptomyces sp. ASQP_92]|uniref:hypothetical protein n=1 Tax=Streptomyces sp. ASQP_92 TaxID=2979116 RepID=UPI0021BFB26B|nr:hypothetical protein [Streptomyces sp. ASQP_92]MCT9094176.1 hypothetical protein [Streptomyces sp. ASQP_92]
MSTPSRKDQLEVASRPERPLQQLAVATADSAAAEDISCGERDAGTRFVQVVEFPVKSLINGHGSPPR